MLHIQKYYIALSAVYGSVLHLIGQTEREHNDSFESDYIRVCVFVFLDV